MWTIEMIKGKGIGVMIQREGKMEVLDRDKSFDISTLLECD